MPACRSFAHWLTALGLAAALLAAPSPVAQAADRAATYQAIDQRCQGLMQASRDDMANLASLGITMPAMCQCIASTMTDKLLPSEVDAIQKPDPQLQLPPRVEALWSASRGFCAVSLKPR